MRRGTYQSEPEPRLARQRQARARLPWLLLPYLKLHLKKTFRLSSKLFPVVVRLHDRLMRVVEVKPGRAIAANGSGKATRGVIQGISRDSRTRLIRFLATINRPDPAWFVTLTYRDWIEDFQIWKGHLHRFLMAVKKRYSCVAGVWRLEFQKRGAPHFHLILWLDQEEDRLALGLWIRARWLAAIGDSSRAASAYATTAEEVRDFRNCGFYLSLYQAKDHQDRTDILTGREWGKVQPKLLSTDPIREVSLLPKDIQLLRRIVRRAYRVRNRVGFRRSTYWRSLGKGERGFSMCLPFYAQSQLVDWVIQQNFQAYLETAASAGNAADPQSGKPCSPVASGAPGVFPELERVHS